MRRNWDTVRSGVSVGANTVKSKCGFTVYLNE